MRIRPKITIWIAGTALFAAVGFSGFIFRELMEEPYKLIDNELQHMAESLFRQLETGRDKNAGTFSAAMLPYPPDQYWIRVTDDRGAVLYASKLARIVDIAVSRGFRPYNIEKIIPARLAQVGQDAHDEVLFRVRVFRHRQAGTMMTVAIAKPIEALEEEIQQLLGQLAAGLLAFTVLVVVVSYFLAGRILRPVVEINGLTRKISESSLDRRLPLGKNQDELYDLTVSLNRMFDRLQFSFERQKEFVGNAAHELKSPITLLMLAQEELSQRPGVDEILRADLVRQTDILRRMKRLVKNLLDLSRLEQQETLSRDVVDMQKLVGSVLAEYDAMLQTGSIRVDNRLAGPLVVEGDQDKLQRLFINLLDNAWRYNRKPDGEIRITGWKKGGRVTLVVANTGPGVPAGETGRVFDQFYRVEKSRSLANGGSGLGLTIARKIVELHGGAIDLVSDPDGWTRVTVSLPARA